MPAYYVNILVIFFYIQFLLFIDKILKKNIFMIYNNICFAMSYMSYMPWLCLFQHEIDICTYTYYKLWIRIRFFSCNIRHYNKTGALN